MKTYLSPTRVNLVNEFGNYVGKLTPTSTNIQRNGYFFTKMEKEAVGKTKSLLENANQSIEQYQTKFEMYRLQLNDKKEGAVKSWEETKEDVFLRLQKINTKLEEGRDKASDKWEHFSEEMKESWKHLRKAING